MTRRFASIFTGIGGFDLAFNRAGWTCTTMCEIDTFIMPNGTKNYTGRYAKKVLSHRFPDVPLLDDVRDVKGGDLGDIDVLVGGFPCQDTSKASGNRHGLKGARSSMYLEFRRLIDEYQRIVDEAQPEIVILENPDGILNSGVKPSALGIAAGDAIDPDNKDHWERDPGADMGVVLRSLSDLGYVGEWRLVQGIDWLPQRRGRVLFVGHRGALGSGPGTVLCDPEPGSISPRADDSRQGQGEGRPPASASAADRLERVMFRKSRRPQSNKDFATWVPENFSNTLTGFDGGLVGRSTQMIVEGDRVRAFTPLEWERLCGFPDGWTDVPGMTESYRWKILGNTMMVPMAEWLAGRIDNATAQTLEVAA